MPDLKIGQEFTCGHGRFRVTDIGTRTITAIRIDQVLVKSRDNAQRELDQAQADREGWFKGPPYAVAEIVFDEYDFEGITPVPQAED